jgi:hypothetical protein
MRKDHLNHKPNADGIKAIENIRLAIITLEDAIDANVPDGREKSIAKTKLEEVRMWAVKGAVFANAEGFDELPEKAA